MNKGLLNFRNLFALEVYQLSFTFVANSKNDAKAFAGNSDKARYLDSLGRKTYLILDLQIST
jgi:hypothetical protein